MLSTDAIRYFIVLTFKKNIKKKSKKKKVKKKVKKKKVSVMCIGLLLVSKQII